MKKLSLSSFTQAEQYVRNNRNSLEHFPDANTRLQPHQPVAFAFWRVFEIFVSFEDAKVISMASGQFERCPEFGDGYRVFDKPPARAALLINPVEQPPPHILAMLSQQRGSLARQSIYDGTRAFVQQAARDLCNRSFDVTVLE